MGAGLRAGPALDPSFEVPSSCLADVYRFDSKGVNRVGGKIAEDVSLPFQLTAVLEPTR